MRPSQSLPQRLFDSAAVAGDASASAAVATGATQRAVGNSTSYMWNPCWAFGCKPVTLASILTCSPWEGMTQNQIRHGRWLWIQNQIQLTTVHAPPGKILLCLLRQDYSHSCPSTLLRHILGHSHCWLTQRLDLTCDKLARKANAHRWSAWHTKREEPSKPPSEQWKYQGCHSSNWFECPPCYPSLAQLTSSFCAVSLYQWWGCWWRCLSPL